jgi:NADPH:quinone reductase-like Zn-dependent oxidoreductase
MRAIVLPEYGPPSALQLRTLPDPSPGLGEIGVRMVGAGINPIDWKQRSGKLRAHMPLQLPAVLGRDVSGTVTEVAAGVTGFAVGDRVLGRVPGGGYAEIVVAPLDAWAHLPDKLDLADAAALPLVLLTGAELAEQAVDAQMGETILVTGATGSVGRVAVYVAKNRGAKVIAGVRRKHRAHAEALGAHGVVMLDDDADIARLPMLDGIADTVGGDVIQRLLGKLVPGGKIGSAVGEPAGAKERGFVVRAFLTHNDPKRLWTLAQMVANDELTIPIAKRFPLDDAFAAHELAERGADGKVLLLGAPE